MSRRSTNFPPGIWRARRDYGRNRSNVNDSNRANSMPPHSHSFENSSRGRDTVPWRPAGEAMLARILDIGSSPEEPPTVVRIITHSRPRSQLQPNPTNPTPNPSYEGEDSNSRLTSEEQNMAINKLKKKTYDPTPNNTPRRISFYYRDNNRENHNNEDGKRSCTVCLEDFEPKEEVMITPCNHMFHEECIVPWVKSHGQCPVCRFELFDRRERERERERQRQRVVSSNNNNVTNVLGNTLDDDELMSIIRAMEEALMLRNLSGFWGA